MTAPDEFYLVYDGDCPFCSAYVQFVRFRDAVGTVHLIDARDGGGIVDDIRAAGFDLDEGMVLKAGNRLYHGADCINALALMSGGSGLFNKLNAWIFKSPLRAKVLYPILRTGRNVALWLLRRQKIHHAAKV